MIDPYSQTWLTVKKWAEDQIETDATNLEAIGQTHDTSNVLRGGISRLRELLDLGSQNSGDAG